jgi:hypothetical protein
MWAPLHQPTGEPAEEALLATTAERELEEELLGAHLPRPHRRLGRALGDEFSTRRPSNLVPPW